MAAQSYTWQADANHNHMRCRPTRVTIYRRGQLVRSHRIECWPLVELIWWYSYGLSCQPGTFTVPGVCECAVLMTVSCYTYFHCWLYTMTITTRYTFRHVPQRSGASECPRDLGVASYPKPPITQQGLTRPLHPIFSLLRHFPFPSHACSLMAISINNRVCLACRGFPPPLCVTPPSRYG
jgi:hypothetical protein